MVEVLGAVLLAFLSGGAGGGLVAAMSRSKEWQRERFERQRDERKTAYLDLLGHLHEAQEAAAASIDAETSDEREGAALVLREALARARQAESVIMVVGPLEATGTADEMIKALELYPQHPHEFESARRDFTEVVREALAPQAAPGTTGPFAVLRRRLARPR